MEAYYEIADLLLQVTGENFAPGFLAGFEALPGVREPSLFLQVNSPAKGTYGVCYQLLPTDSCHLLTSEQDGSCRLTADADWHKAVLTAGENQVQEQMELLAAAFYARLSFFGGLLLHASAVEYRGKSIVFIAPSGTGKTTQAELWQKYMGARILNGDKVFLRARDGQVYAYGSPWKGSSPYGENASAPVAALVVLGQSPENILQRLEGIQGVQAVMPHLFYPSWDEKSLHSVMATMDQLLPDLPVFRLTCRPDRESVELLKEGLQL